MDGNKDRFEFHFNVYGFFDGDQIRFAIDNDVMPGNDGKYIFDKVDEEWVTCTDELFPLDSKICSELIHRISLIGKDEIPML